MRACPSSHRPDDRDPARAHRDPGSRGGVRRHDDDGHGELHRTWRPAAEGERRSSMTELFVVRSIGAASSNLV